MVAGSLAAGNLQNLVVDKLYASQRVFIFSCLLIPKQFFFSFPPFFTGSITNRDGFFFLATAITIERRHSGSFCI